VNKYQRLSIFWAISIPVFYLLGQLLGYFIFWSLGYVEGQSVIDGPVIDRFIISIPVGIVMLMPCVQAVRYGFAAKRTVGRRALIPTLAGALAGSFISFSLLVSLIGLA
jgi:hypothetical protein